MIEIQLKWEWYLDCWPIQLVSSRPPMRNYLGRGPSNYACLKRLLKPTVSWDLRPLLSNTQRVWKERLVEYLNIVILLQYTFCITYFCHPAFRRQWTNCRAGALNLQPLSVSSHGIWNVHGQAWSFSTASCPENEATISPAFPARTPVCP